jgi:purine-binding chemotaxis protein CheW
MVEISPLSSAPRPVLGIINLHGVTVPVFDLAERIDGRAGDYPLSAKLLLVKTPSRRFAIGANEVAGASSLPAEVITSLEPLAPGAGIVPSVAAIAGRLIYVFDLIALLSSDEDRQLETALQLELR